jgi:O-6-methylguanine DNA methyltransferase
MRLRLERRASPVSELLLITDEDGALRALDFAGHETRMFRLLRLHYGSCALDEGAAPAGVNRALDAYFAGDLDALAEVRVATGGTPFQRAVWRALRAIPSGATTSYGELAAGIGRTGASRAVGAANGANPIAIVVPCHRVIGASGALTGFASGLGRKRWLLDHERRFAGPGPLRRSGARGDASTAADAGLQYAFVAKEDPHALFADLQVRPRHRGRAHARALPAD